MLEKLNKFQDEVLEMDQMSSQLPLTYLAYSNALAEILRTYTSKLVELELVVTKQGIFIKLLFYFLNSSILFHNLYLYIFIFYFFRNYCYYNIFIV